MHAMTLDHYTSREAKSARRDDSSIFPPPFERTMALMLVVFCVPGTAYEVVRFVYQVVRDVAGGVPHPANALACFTQGLLILALGPGIRITRHLAQGLFRLPNPLVHLAFDFLAIHGRSLLLGDGDVLFGDPGTATSAYADPARESLLQPGVLGDARSQPKSSMRAQAHPVNV
jgi:hypothetical protein